MPLELQFATSSFYWDDETYDVSDIRSLKSSFISNNPTKFALVVGGWTDELVTSLIEAFQDFAEKKIEWGSFCLESDITLRHTRPVLFTANSLSIFRHVEINGYLIEEDFDPPTGLGESLFPGIALNKRLESLHISLPLGANQLRDGDKCALNSYLATTQTLENLHFSIIANPDVVGLCHGLSRNRTLKLVSMDVSLSEIDDVSLAQIIGALESIPSVRSLEIEAHDCFKRHSLLALNRLINSSSTLYHLEITDQAACPELSHLLDNLRINHSLKSLFINTCLRDENKFQDIPLERRLHHTMPLTKLFRALSSFPSLEEVSFYDNVYSKEDMENVLELKRLEMPLRFELRLRRLSEMRLLGALKNILDAHPELIMSRPKPWDKKFFSEHDLYVLDLNYFGRYLIDRPEVLPAVWSLVLERANRNPSVIFEFLKGPAFAARHTFHRSDITEPAPKKLRHN